MLAAIQGGLLLGQVQRTTRPLRAALDAMLALISVIIVGIDAHKRTHTAVAIDGNGRQLATRTIATTSKDHLALLRWADQFGSDRQWAVEDCRHLSRRLEHDLLAAGEQIARVSPKLMAHVRDAARTFGKSDPIDALAVARAVLREPNLPTARLDGPDREVRLLGDHRDALVAERTRVINRLRWHLHELDPQWDPAARSLDRHSAYDKIDQRLQDMHGAVARLAHRMVEHARRLTTEIDELTAELTTLVGAQAPALLTVPGCGVLTAAKILGETAGVDRFASKDAYARHNGTAPLPVWSSNRAGHRLSRTGNRQLNAALHRLALTQARCPPTPRPCSTAARPVATAASKPSECSNADSPTSSTERYWPTPNPRSTQSRLDRGASALSRNVEVVTRLW